VATWNLGNHLRICLRDTRKPRKTCIEMAGRRTFRTLIFRHFGKQIKKCMGSFEMWCWRRIQNISWADRVRNEEILHAVKEDTNTAPTVKKEEGSWIYQILRRNWLLNTLLKERQTKWYNWREDDEEDVSSYWMIFKETRGYWNFKAEAPARSLWGSPFGTVYGPVVRLRNNDECSPPPGWLSCYEWDR
jgi:hypothetical protein